MWDLKVKFRMRAKAEGVYISQRNLVLENERMAIDKIIKRNGKVVAYDHQRIVNAVENAIRACPHSDTPVPAPGTSTKEAAETIADKVLEALKETKRKHKNFTPNVEGIQEEVENMLIESNWSEVAKAYIRYRHLRNEERNRRVKNLMSIPERVRALFEESKKYFRSQMAEFTYIRTYARWIESEKRRECWIETVDRVVDFMKSTAGDAISEEEWAEVRRAILDMEVMPSMRMMQFAGETIKRDNISAYNCAYAAPECIKDLADAVYISMAGTGYGFSVEEYNVQKFPIIERQKKGCEKLTHVVEDTSEGWAEAFRIGLNAWFNGRDIDFDTSQLRPKGARLKTKGGRSSGPQPLVNLLRFARGRILKRQRKRLRTIDLHDILCMVGDTIVSGGVRRTAMISLSGQDDELMAMAKYGSEWQAEHAYRWRANNSAVYEQKPDSDTFSDEWAILRKGKSGERGIFNRGGLVKTLPERRLKVLREMGYFDDGDSDVPEDWAVVGFIGTNPCGEIILISHQFCNLTEVICRPEDTKEDLVRKQRISALIGTVQSTLTNFKYISPKWKQNCERERLLGCSLTGIWDCDAARVPSVMRELKEVAIEVNREYAERLGITASTATTCVKPSGTVSIVCDASAGMHPRHSRFYKRGIQLAATDSLLKMLQYQKYPCIPIPPSSGSEVTAYYVPFAVQAPGNSIVNEDVSARELMDLWKLLKLNYTEHNPSVSIYVAKDEWTKTEDWIYRNWDVIGGMSFFPRMDENTIYDKTFMPYVDLKSRDAFDKLSVTLPGIDFSQLLIFEREDTTTRREQLACSGGVCEVHA